MAKKQAAESAAQEEKQAKSKEAKPAKADNKPKEAKTAKQDARPKAPKINPVKRFINYVEASRAELRKVTWPTLAETRKATLAVLGFVGIMAIILGLIDLGLSSLIKTILS